MLANSNTSTKATARTGRDDIRPSQATDTYHLSESALRAVKYWLFSFEVNGFALGQFAPKGMFRLHQELGQNDHQKQ